MTTLRQPRHLRRLRHPPRPHRRETAMLDVLAVTAAIILLFLLVY
ncbi:hypothetical protein BC102111_03470, partial [Brevibacterium casei CIP 102111]